MRSVKAKSVSDWTGWIEMPMLWSSRPKAIVVKSPIFVATDAICLILVFVVVCFVI